MARSRLRVRIVDGCLRRGERFIFSLIVCLVPIAGGNVHASAALVSRSPEERSLGTSRAMLSLVFDAPGGPGTWRIDAGEWLLFAVDGLRASTVTFERAEERWGAALSAAVVTSPIGRASALRGAVMISGSERVLVECEFTLDSVELDGCERSLLATAAVRAYARATPRLGLLSCVEGIRIGGESAAGADASLAAVLFPDLPLSGIARISVSRDGDLSFGVASRVRISSGTSVALGFDERSGALSGSFFVWLRSMGFEVGASVHPVLGLSEAVFLSWRK